MPAQLLIDLRSKRVATLMAMLTSAALGLSPMQGVAADLICRGNMPAANLNFSTLFTRGAGFVGPVEFRQHETGAWVVESSPLQFDRTNDRGQGVYRAHVGGMADVVLIDLAETQPHVGSEISVGYDGRWGRGVCVTP